MASNNIQLASGSGTGQNTRVLSNVEAQQLLQVVPSLDTQIVVNEIQFYDFPFSIQNELLSFLLSINVYMVVLMHM